MAECAQVSFMADTFSTAFTSLGTIDNRILRLCDDTVQYDHHAAQRPVPACAHRNN